MFENLRRHVSCDVDMNVWVCCPQMVVVFVVMLIVSMQHLALLWHVLIVSTKAFHSNAQHHILNF